MKKSAIILTAALFSVIIIYNCVDHKEDILLIPVSPDAHAVITEQIQHAIDSVGNASGGTVYFAKGKYITGGLYLRSNVTLKFEKGAVLGAGFCLYRPRNRHTVVVLFGSRRRSDGWS